jgi:hypothetical protein
MRKFAFAASSPACFSTRWFLPAVCLVCCAFLYLETFVLPNVPRAPVGDQGIFLHDAARMFDGEEIYRDFDEFIFPGLLTYYWVLFKVFGVQTWIPQVTLVFLGAAHAWLAFGIARSFLSGASALLVSFLFLTLPFSSYLDATHHWFSVLAVTAALMVLIRARTPARLAWAGGLWGLATWFAQSRVLGLFGLTLYLIWEHRRQNESLRTLITKGTCLTVSFLAVVVSLSAYFVWRGGLRAFYFQTVVYVTRYYSTYRYNNLGAYMRGKPSIHDWTNWGDLVAWPVIHLIVPLVYVWFLVRYWRKSGTQLDVPWDRLMLVNITGLTLFLTVASAPAYNRLYTVSLPALMLLVWLLQSSSAVSRTLVGGLWALVLALGLMKPLITQLRSREILDLPTGRTAFFSSALAEHTRWVSDRTSAGEYFFGYHVVGVMLRLRNPSRVAFLRAADYTRPEQVESLVKGLESRQVRIVSWLGGLDPPAGTPGDNLAPVRRYLRDHYQVGKTFPDGVKVWERLQVPSNSRQ